MEKPNYFPNVIGQEDAKSVLTFYIEGFKANGVMPNIMLTAPRGCGKTWIAQALARCLVPHGEVKPKKLVTFNCSQLKNLSQFMNEIIIPHVNGQDCTVFFDEASELPKDVAMALLTILLMLQLLLVHRYLFLTISIKEVMTFSENALQCIWTALVVICMRILL